ncbi:type I-E CRISPR-associated protein Cse1/CasA [Streptomyces sp. NRRL S-1868]|uniref:type I-E CRISPR-associated protein Cse1/CasA n=1 Tax=Streptomyces sp. NRRL S-1868 TaxID=1463892 RepID=UPI0004C48C1D|nr:type I-E CRISPR-associated protein Cse1/CasA [Streptomyces sp. NRRL S-1868]
MAPSFPLTTSPWIPVYDLDSGEQAEIGLAEALSRAHRLVFPVVRSVDVPLWRVLTAAYDAACGPRTQEEWDLLWRAEAFDAAAVGDYFARWEHRLDLYDPQRPAFQCADLDDFNRGADQLDPALLGGESAGFFHARLDRGEAPPLPAGEAARRLLHLLSYDVAGIRPAAPGDPAGRGGKSYGGQLPPLASAAHCHAVAGASLKATLMLSVPPGPRAEGDAPVWEREGPPPRRRVRPAAGRMDLWTWPARRVRLHPVPDGRTDRIAFYDGDRLPAPGWTTICALDPMTAWWDTSSGQPRPYTGTDPAAGSPLPWTAAHLLGDTGPYSRSLEHLVQACARGLLDDAPVSVALSAPTHTSRHQSAMRSLEVTTIEAGTAGQLASPAVRAHLAGMARAADHTAELVQWAAHRVMTRRGVGGYSREVLASRLSPAALDMAWTEAVDDSRPESDETGLGAVAGRWQEAVHAALDCGLDALRLPHAVRAEIDLTLQEPQRARAVRAPKRGVALYEAFGGRYSLSQISRHPDCVVSYNLLRARVEEQGWPAQKAATTPARRGRPKKHAER